LAATYTPQNRESISSSLKKKESCGVIRTTAGLHVRAQNDRFRATISCVPTTPDSPVEITYLLAAWSSGDQGAFDSLFPLLYPTLSRLANRELRNERPGHTLQTTALVHEAFLELAGQRQVQFKSRGHFLAVASFVMRRILTEHARTRAALKRGGGNVVALTQDPDSIEANAGLAEITAVDAAINDLEKIDARAARVVVLRFFGGLSHEDTAEALGVSVITVKREWAAAKAWLKQELSAS
jgi:RNA polymerase sigma factor (TIGR02999 family)